MTAYPSATAMAWDLAGRPYRDGLPVSMLPGRCAVCGTLAEETVPAKATVANGTFTDQYLLADPSSGVTCYPCAWVMSGRPPNAVRQWTVACAAGRDLGWSHPKCALAGPPVGVAVMAGSGADAEMDAWLDARRYERAAAGALDGTWRLRAGARGPVREAPVRPRLPAGLLFTARNDMRPVAALLADPPDGPWCVAVAESGQKHTLPFTPLNYGAGSWGVRMDAVTVTCDPAVFRGLLGRSAVLRQAGFGADAIEHLNPPVYLLDSTRLPLWREHAGHLTPWKGSPALHLANFMIKKDHYDHYITACRP